MQTIYTVKKKNDTGDSGMVFFFRKQAEQYLRFVHAFTDDWSLYDIYETQTEDDGVPVVVMDVYTGQVVMWRWDTPYNKGYYPRTQPYRDRRVVVFPVKTTNGYTDMLQQAERLYAEWKENQ